MLVGAVIPPHRGCIRRERPSTPSAPYGLTRPVVPPDGSFVLADISSTSVRRDRLYWLARGRGRGPHLSHPRGNSAHPGGTSAIPVRRLTVNGEDRRRFSRRFADQWPLVRTLAGQRKSFPQNIHVASIDSFPLRPRPFFSSRAGS